VIPSCAAASLRVRRATRRPLWSRVYRCYSYASSYVPQTPARDLIGPRVQAIADRSDRMFGLGGGQGVKPRAIADLGLDREGPAFIGPFAWSAFVAGRRSAGPAGPDRPGHVTGEMSGNRLRTGSRKGSLSFRARAWVRRHADPGSWQALSCT
jgi:hypothetical protein